MKKRIITVGGSAGGLQAFLKIISLLNAEHPVSVFVVLHGGSSNLLDIVKQRLASTNGFELSFAENKTKIEPGFIYLAPPDRHMLLHENSIHVNKGPRVNLSRPSIDLLFRSAAVAYDTQTIGVLLSGSLYDGVAGLQAVKLCGGITIIQDPADAEYPDLPGNAMEIIDADYIKTAMEIAPLLGQLVKSAVTSKKAVPREIALENELDLKNTNDISTLNEIGTEAALSCPECGGPLWEISHHEPAHYRCHTGHSYNVQSLEDGQSSEVEKTLWVALKTLEEKKRIQEKMSLSNSKSAVNKRIIQSRIEETNEHIKRLRDLILNISIN